MKAILLRVKNMDEGVIEMIYEQQLKFTIAKKRRVSLEQTVSKLLKEAYLSKPDPKEEK